MVRSTLRKHRSDCWVETRRQEPEQDNGACAESRATVSSLARRIWSDSAEPLKAKTKECANGLDVGVRKNKSLSGQL